MKQDEETKQEISKLIEFEDKYSQVFVFSLKNFNFLISNLFSKIYSWILNLGETFLAQHRDFGVDISYISDYIDNHQQIILDLRENESSMRRLQIFADDLIKSTNTNDTKSKQINENIEILQQKWSRLKRVVENRISLSSVYLEYVKCLNELRNCSLDIQELINTYSDFSPNTASTSQAVYETHIKDKTKTFEKLFESVLRTGNYVINELKKVRANCVTRKTVF